MAILWRLLWCSTDCPVGAKLLFREPSVSFLRGAFLGRSPPASVAAPLVPALPPALLEIAPPPSFAPMAAEPATLAAARVTEGGLAAPDVPPPLLRLPLLALPVACC